MIPKNRYICALDIGSTKVCAILADLDSKEIIVDLSSSAARGVNQGIVVNPDDLTDVIADVVAKLEQKAEFRIKDVYTNISGFHIEGRNVKGKVVISEQGSGITAYDIDKAVNFAENFVLPLERKIIHRIVQDYAIDGQGGIANPINLYGQELEVNLYIITASTEAIEKVTNSISCAGLHARGLLLSAIASGWGVLTDEERRSGVLLMDIGGGTLDLAIFKGGMVRFARAVPVGDLNSDGLVSLIKESLENAVYSSHAVFSHAVISGGYASNGQLPEKIEEALGVPTRIGTPHREHPDLPQLRSPAYATGLGLIQYVINREKEQKSALKIVCTTFNKLAFWLKKTFSTYF